MNIDTSLNKFADMAQKMGMGVDITQKKQTAQLARLKIQHSPIMGEVEVKGKKTQAAIVNGGSYRIDDLASESIFYSDDVTISPYVQRFMYKKFVKPESGKGFYVKTIMADNLNIDLKDNQGTFNCGKPSGYIKDFSSLSADMQNLIKQIKRVRVLFGLITMKDVKTEKSGKLTEVKDVPFIWEIDNREAFKIVGKPFATLSTMRKLPVQHTITALGDPRDLASGEKFYVPKVMLDTTKSIELSDKDQTTFTDFISWIENYNTYIMSMWDDKVNSNISKDDEDTVSQFVQIDNEDVA